MAKCKPCKPKPKDGLGERLKEYDRVYIAWLLESATGVKPQTAHVLTPIHIK